jgi:hypothetical protein
MSPRRRGLVTVNHSLQPFVNPKGKCHDGTAFAALPSPQHDINAYFAPPVAPARAAERAIAARHGRSSCRVFGHLYQECADETFNLWTACVPCGQISEN